MHHLTHATLISDRSYLERFMHWRRYKGATHSIFTLFREKFGIASYFWITIKLGQIWKKTKNIQFSKKHTISRMWLFERIIHIFSGWRTGYVTRPRLPSIFTLFRDIFVITFYFQIAINIDQIWKKIKISKFSTSALPYDFNDTNRWFIPSVVSTQEALQGLNTIGHFGICQRNNCSYENNISIIIIYMYPSKIMLPTHIYKSLVICRVVFSIL